MKELICPDCGKKLILQDMPYSWKKKGKVFLCEDYPSCKGKMSATKKGVPLGVPACERTRKMRLALHNIFDRLWSNQKERTYCYRYLAAMLDIEIEDCHFSHFDVDMLTRAYFTILECGLTPKDVKEICR